MAFPGAAVQACTITANLFDGTRQVFPATTDVLYTIIDGNQHVVYREYHRTSSLRAQVRFHANFGDWYSVVAHAEGHEQVGFYPVKVAPNIPQQVDLMLLKKDASYNFSGAQWADIQRKRPALARVLAADAASPEAAQERYRDLLENRSATLAGLLNIATTLDQIHLPAGQPLDYFKQLVWDQTMKQDRFFGFADIKMVDQVRLAAQQGAFVPEPGSFIFHPGATSSFKQIQFGEANLQLTFHEKNRRIIDDVECVMVEPDIDYYKDLAAHALLEVLPNGFSGSLADPRQVYVLRWMAGRHAGVPEFDPLYTIA